MIRRNLESCLEMLIRFFIIDLVSGFLNLFFGWEYKIKYYYNLELVIYRRVLRFEGII